MSTKTITCLLACLLLPACVTRVANPPAPLQQQSAVEQFQVEDGKARVHFFLGEYFVYSDSDTCVRMNEAAEIYVNDIKIGLIGNKQEYMAIDIPHGTYSFKWVSISEKCRQETLQLSSKENELIFLKANKRNNASSYTSLLGPLGAVATLDIVTYFENDPKLKSNLREYTLVSLNKDFKPSVSTQKTEQNKPQTEGEAASTTEKKLSELKIMYEKELITKEEYDAKRKELIGKY